MRSLMNDILFQPLQNLVKGLKKFNNAKKTLLSKDDGSLL